MVARRAGPQRAQWVTLRPPPLWGLAVVVGVVVADLPLRLPLPLFLLTVFQNYKLSGVDLCYPA